MKTSISFFLCILLTCAIQFKLSANTASQVLGESEPNALEMSSSDSLSLEKTWKSFSQKKQNKIKKRLGKLKDHFQKRQAKRALKEERFAEESATSGVTLGLIIILGGALIALLGFAGLADFLVTIGLIILIVGVILWLVDRL